MDAMGDSTTGAGSGVSHARLLAKASFSRTGRRSPVHEEMRQLSPAEQRHASAGSELAAADDGGFHPRGPSKRQNEVGGKISFQRAKNCNRRVLGVQNVSTAAAIQESCARDLDPPPNPPGWAGWGSDPQNSRFQPALAAGMKPGQIKNLKLKWTFGFPGAAATFGQPTSFAGKLLVGSEDGTVYALDSATGCMWWSFKASATVKTAISIGNKGAAALFGDTNGYVYALSVADGSVLWKVHPDSHPAARITGSPLLVGSRLYVPISSGEEGAAADPAYPCCTFRGSVVALDTTSGKQIWQAYTLVEVPSPRTRMLTEFNIGAPRLSCMVVSNS